MVYRHLIFLWQSYQKSQCLITSFMSVDSQGMEHWFSDNDQGRYSVLLKPEAVRMFPAHGDFLFLVSSLTWQFGDYGDFLIMQCQCGSGD